MLRSRCCKMSRLSLLLLLIACTASGCSWFKNRPARDHWWQLWRPKVAGPQIAIIPDTEILPPLDGSNGNSSDMWVISDGSNVAGATGGVPENEPRRENPEGILLDLAMINFDYDSPVLSGQAKETLAGHAKWLGQHPDIVIQIEGHCDERGTFEYNMNLGQRRADSVREYLLGLGIAADRLYTISYGEERMIDNADTEAAHNRNRRAQFLAYGAE